MLYKCVRQHFFSMRFNWIMRFNYHSNLRLNKIMLNSNQPFDNHYHTMWECTIEWRSHAMYVRISHIFCILWTLYNTVIHVIGECFAPYHSDYTLIRWWYYKFSNRLKNYENHNDALNFCLNYNQCWMSCQTIDEIRILVYAMCNSGNSKSSDETHAELYHTTGIRYNWIS